MFGRHVEGLSRLLASTDEDRLDVSARGDPRGHHGELERIDQHITLADHRVEGVRPGPFLLVLAQLPRSEEHTSELQSLMRISYDVFCLKKKQKHQITPINQLIQN